MDNIKSEPRTLFELFSGAKSKFFIPDYQRPYEWTEKHCDELWFDLIEFTLNNPDFDPDASEYFLGTMITFFNAQRKDEIVDGQQRITTLLLLMRAFYVAIEKYVGSPLNNDLAKCIWLVDERGLPNKSTLKLTSELLSDEANEELASILINGKSDKTHQGTYATNYRFFQRRISELGNDSLELLIARILNNCCVIKIRADTQNAALQMFETINDKGCPLTDTDIFKSVLYKQALASGGLAAKDIFLEQWGRLEQRSNNIFSTLHVKKITPFSFAFQTYSYKFPSHNGHKQLREVYSKDNYARLKDPQTLKNMFAMLDFLQDLRELNRLRFSEDTLRRAYILFRINNAVCYHALVTYFFRKCDENYNIEDDDFRNFLDNVTIVLLGVACTGGVGVNLTGNRFDPIQNQSDAPPKTTAAHMVSRAIIENNLRNFSTMRGKTFCRQVVLNWWTFKNENQELLDLDTKFTIEHIFPKKRLDFEFMDSPQNIELLGNLALLEKNVNSRASDYRFADKKKFYIGFADSNCVYKRGTNNRELQQLATLKNDFTEADIIDRNEQMIAEIIALLDKRGFLQK